MLIRSQSHASLTLSNQELLLRIKELEDREHCHTQEIARLSGPAQVFWRCVLFTALLRLYNMSLAETHGVSLQRDSHPVALITLDNQCSGHSGTEGSAATSNRGIGNSTTSRSDADSGSTSPRSSSPSSQVFLRRVMPPSCLAADAASHWAVIFDRGNLLEELRQVRNTAAHEATAKDLKDAIIYLDGGVPMELVLVARLSFDAITGCQWDNATSQYCFDDGARALRDAIRAKHASERARQNASACAALCKKRKAEEPPSDQLLYNSSYNFTFRVTLPRLALPAQGAAGMPMQQNHPSSRQVMPLPGHRTPKRPCTQACC